MRVEIQKDYIKKLDSDYEAPSDPEIKLKTLSKNPEELADEVLDYLKVNNII